MKAILLLVVWATTSVFFRPLSAAEALAQVGDPFFGGVATPANSPQITAVATVPEGKKLFTTYCGGCHGFNGIASYDNAPSFALGERMEKSDHELLRSITNGKGVMPSWEYMLSAQQRQDILTFVRRLQARFKAGTEGRLSTSPDFYYRFRPLGETGDEWLGADPMGIPPSG